MTGQGGWPMTCFLTPGRRAVLLRHVLPEAGVPAAARLGDRSLAGPARRRAQQAGQRIVAALAAAAGAEPRRRWTRPCWTRRPRRCGPRTTRRRAASAARRSSRRRWCCEFLLRRHARTGDGLDLVVGTAEAMARGGMYDQLAGGFARYSVDADWVVPHFEKMLYDNALLLRVYLHLWRETGSPLARRVVRETAEFLLARPAYARGRVRLGAGRGRRPAMEGLTYVWTPAQLIAVLGDEDGEWAAAAAGGDRGGHVRAGRLHAAAARPTRDDPAALARRCAASCSRARDARPQPARDDKVVAAWNGLAIAALAEAGALLGEPGWVDAAAAAAELLLATRTWSTAGCGALPGRHGRRAGRRAGGLRRPGRGAARAAPGHRRGALAGRAPGELLDTVLARFARRPAAGSTTPPTTPSSWSAGPRDPTDNADAVRGGGRGRRAADVRRADRLGPAPGGGRGGAGRRSRRSSRRTPRFGGWAAAVAEAALAGPLRGRGRRRRPRRRWLDRRPAGTRPGRSSSPGEPDAPGVPLLADRPLVDGAAGRVRLPRVRLRRARDDAGGPGRSLAAQVPPGADARQGRFSPRRTGLPGDPSAGA